MTQIDQKISSNQFPLMVYDYRRVVIVKKKDKKIENTFEDKSGFFIRHFSRFDSDPMTHSTSNMSYLRFLFISLCMISNTFDNRDHSLITIEYCITELKSKTEE